VAMAECLSFNQTLGFVGDDPLSADMLKYITFYRQNREIFHKTEDVATVAVLRSYPSLAYHNAKAQLSAILIEQTLIQSRIPFDLVFDEHLADLSKYKVLILPDSECLSEQQITAVRQFVDRGGGLLASGGAGLYDEWRRVRVRPGLSGLADSQPRAEAYQERVEGSDAAARLPVRQEYGKGRVVYFFSLPLDGIRPDPSPYFNIDNRFWKRPKNWPEIQEAIRWAGKAAFPVEVSGPAYLVANLVSQSDKQRLLLHLVNYNARNAPSIQSVDVNLQTPNGKTIKEVRLITPDSTHPENLEFSKADSRITFTVPEVKTYSVIVVSW